MVEFETNEISGHVAGNVVQAGAVHGGIHIHRAATPPTLPIPRQLPGPPPFLIGRERELDRLDNWSRQDHSGPVVLTGPAGAGKAALCLTWLYRDAAGYPDGALYADLRAIGDPVQPLAVLRGFLAALGLPADSIPPDLAGSAALFRSASAGRRMAVMLHGATSAAQVRPLIPGGATCRTVITSTWQLAGLRSDGARWLTVGPLETHAAVLLLQRVAGLGLPAHEPDGNSHADADTDSDRSELVAAFEVARLCGGLPLAVCLVGHRVAYNPYERLSRVAEELKDETRRLDRLTEEGEGVRAVIDSCYRGLSPEAARLYRILGGLPLARLCTIAACAAADLPEVEVRDLLRTLTQANLLQQHGEDTYQFHELIRLHARERSRAMPGEEREESIIRVENWYLSTAVAAATAVRPYRRDRPAEVTGLAAPPLAFPAQHTALDWLDAEATQLLGLARHAADRQRPRIALRIAGQMWSLFAHRKYYCVWQEFDLLGLRCARELGDRGTEARMLRRLGLLACDLGRYDEAADHLRAAASLYEQLGDRHRRATAVNSLGVVALRRGDPEDAIQLLEHALAVHLDLGDARQSALVRIDLGDALIETGRCAEALCRLAEAEEGLRGSPDLSSTAHLRMLTGRALGRLGSQPARARTELDAAGECMRELRSIAGEAEALGYEGELAEREGRSEEAASSYRRAAALLGQLGTPSSAWLHRRISSLSQLAARCVAEQSLDGPDPAPRPDPTGPP
ncbi:tetratricopeptide repeat protein [Actinocrinis puniceicyclus]|uniref:Tetratricopeptide repeat protein n=1 Tax=Actinocrinis puniceicyclus TaxID=977794 RepID=A0A8J7WNJ5_9ACTN|nr:tetratricopeptide repeat protein [Actinocrinis puniceicyclus]MBS2965666.1 tetratricopeptide repeat protein [Actinocrinis puniceicyclus]